MTFLRRGSLLPCLTILAISAPACSSAESELGKQNGGPTGGDASPSEDSGVTVGGRSGGNGAGGMAAVAGGSAGTASGGKAGAVSVGGAGTGSDADAGTVPLPPRPAWHPAFELGSSGWRNSTEPFCSEIVADLTPRVWSNADAVYVSVSSQCGTLGRAICNTSDVTTERLYRNDGNGWRVIYEEANNGPMEISGYPDGRVVLATSGDCAVREVRTDGTSKCLWSDKPFNATRASVASMTELFVLGSYLDDTETLVLLEYDGTRWTSLKSWQGLAAALATTPSTALVAGFDTFAWADDLASGTLSALPGVPAGDYTGVWGYEPDAVILGDGAGRLVSFDGMRWTVTETSFNDSIQGMWGAPDKTVFAYAQSAFGSLKGGVFTKIFGTPPNQFPSHSFADVWGNASTEVFLTVNDNDFKPYTCGTTFLVWFDGSKFHQF